MSTPGYHVIPTVCVALIKSITYWTVCLATIGATLGGCVGLFLVTPLMILGDVEKNGWSIGPRLAKKVFP